MRQLTVLLALAWTSLSPLAAETVRVAAWDLDGCEVSSAESLPTESGQRRLRQVAAGLRPINADIIVLRGIPDRQVAQFVAGLLRPSIYHVALHSSLRNSSPATPDPSLTILSKRPAFRTQTTEWRSLGQAELPGGFAFAGVSFGTAALCVYAVDLPRDPGNAPGDVNSSLALRRREIAAQHLAHHARSLGATPAGQVPSFLLITDLFTGTRQIPPEAAVRTLQQSGFKLAATTQAPNKHRGYSREELDLPPLFSAFLARNAEFATSPQIPARKGLNQVVSAFDLTLPSGGFADSGLGLAFSRIAAPGFKTTDGLVVWLWSGAAGLFVVLMIAAVWIYRRSTPSARVFAGTQNPRFSSYSRPPFAHEPDWYTQDDRADAGTIPDPDSAAEDSSGWGSPEADSGAVTRLPEVRRGVTSQLRRLMRERLISWLTSQRSMLLASHDTGTQKVMELEQRLRRLHAELEGRLQERELRIAALEEDIAAKEKVIRDLLRSQVSLAEGEGEEGGGVSADRWPTEGEPPRR